MNNRYRKRNITAKHLQHLLSLRKTGERREGEVLFRGLANRPGQETGDERVKSEKSEKSL